MDGCFCPGNLLGAKKLTSAPNQLPTPSTRANRWPSQASHPGLPQNLLGTTGYTIKVKLGVFAPPLTTETILSPLHELLLPCLEGVLRHPRPVGGQLSVRPSLPCSVPVLP